MWLAHVPARHAAFLLLVSACAGAATPTAFSRNQRIPLGPYVVTVARTEAISGSAFAGVNSDLSKAGKQVLAVFLGIDGVKSREYARLRLLFMKFKLEDSEGRSYPGVVPMTVTEYQMLMSGTAVGSPMDFNTFESWSGPTGVAPREWVFLFAVPDKSRGFTLLIDNPTPEAGQADVAAIPLGR